MATMSKQKKKKTGRKGNVIHRSDPETLRVFGSLIAHKRISAGITSADMASSIGVSQPCLSRIENGNRELRLEILYRLSQRLPLEDVVIHYLRTGTFPAPV
jgi:DNA-binding XRE family transcriptional regulator